VDGVSSLMTCHFLAAASALTLGPLVTRLPLWMTELSGRMGYAAGSQFLGMLLGGAVVMLVPATLMGVVFPLASRLLMSDLATAGRSLGRALWANTAGSVAGSVLTGFVLIPTLSLKGCLLALATVQAGLGLALLPWSRLSRGRAVALALSGCALVALTGLNFRRLLPGPNPFDVLHYEGDRRVSIVAHRDDVTASVTVIDFGLRALRINGFEAAADSGAPGAGYMPMMSHLPMLINGGARRVLVICFGTGSTAGSVLLHPGAQVDVVDINRSVLDFAPYFHRTNHGVDADPRARLILDDGRSYLSRTEETYDVITSEPMPPHHAGVVNLYSREYYGLARRRLNPGGVLVQWLPFHLVTFEEAREILRTVQDVFPETTLWFHSGTGLIIARAGAPVVFDWATVAKAYATPELASDLRRLEVPSPEALFEKTYMMGPEAVRDLTRGVPAITDNRPSLEFYSPTNRFTFYLGAYEPENAFFPFLTLTTLRPQEEVPLRGLPDGEVARLRAGWRAQVLGRAGEVWLKAGRLREATRDLKAGLALAVGPVEQVPFLYGLALAAQEGHDERGALAYAERGVQEDPTQAEVRTLRDALRARSVGHPATPQAAVDLSRVNLFFGTMSGPT